MPDRLRLALISFLTLFFELALIRFINANMQVVAYFANFLILSAFLGIGFGCVLAARRRGDLFVWFAAVFTAVVAAAVFLGRFTPAGDLRDETQFLRGATGHTLPASVEIVLIFFANLAFFVPLGHELGRTFARIENKLVAYAWDLAGSFLGVLIFGLLSFLETSPVVWFSIGCAVAVLLLIDRGALHAIFAVVLFVPGVWISTQLSGGLWSPYYHITMSPYFSPQNDYLGFSILVDRLRIQDALHFTRALRASPLGKWFDYYALPYAIQPPGNVLILGGGSGNDATIALAAGAKQVTVVEIDPVIVALGFALHPHRPYLDPRVRVVNDDGRAFLRRGDETYDTIVMNAVDSHTQLPGLAALRLESFLYTTDSFRDVRRHMRPDSLFVLHLSSSRPWMAERVFASLTDAFGREPARFTTARSPYGSIAYVYGPDVAIRNAVRPGSPLIRLAPDPALRRPGIPRATDDWPQLYLRDRTIPPIYIVVLTIIVAITFSAFGIAGRIRTRGDIHLFMLGAGFMLLETRSITNASLLFGLTWIVNAIVISGILFVVFAGNLLVLRGVRVPRRVAYAALFALLLLDYLVPPRWILPFPFAVRVVAGALWLAAPILFTSLIFSEAFDRAGDATAAFGANLLGVVVGGALEYSSMVIGLNALYLIALAVYVAASVVDRAWIPARE